MMKMNRRTVAAALASVPVAALLPGAAWAQKPLVLGFSQVGAESEWRTANTESIKSAAKEAGIELKFSDAQQKQENQIKAIRSFIAQKVDVIAFSPVVESGWGAVLREANRRHMHERGHVIYLRSAPEDVFRRVRHDTARPLLQVDDPLARLRSLFEATEPARKAPSAPTVGANIG